MEIIKTKQLAHTLSTSQNVKPLYKKSKQVRGEISQSDSTKYP